MPKQLYALEIGKPKRLELSWGFAWSEFTVRLDGAVIGTVAGGRAALERGATFALGDGSILRLRLVRGLLGRRLHLHVDDRPVPGSAAVPIPRWAYPFIAACSLVVILGLGGIATMLLGGIGATTCAAIARNGGRSVATRIFLCCLVTVACWFAFLVLILYVFVATHRRA